MVDGFINFNLNEKTPTIIKVIGVGGGGGNAVEYSTRKGSVMSILSFVIQIIRRSATVRFLVKFSWGKS